MAAPRRNAKPSADTESSASAEPETQTEEPALEHSDKDDKKRARSGMEAAYIDALMRERAGYEQRGLTKRVAQVNAELERLGAKTS